MEIKTTDIWGKYQNGKDHHDTLQMYTEIEKYHRFYIGDQWYGLKTGNRSRDTIPVSNFIKPVGKYKISMIAQNNMAIVYSSMGNDEATAQLCEYLNILAEKTWEKTKMDTIAWETIKNAFIAGGHYTYWYDDREQNPDSIIPNRTPSIKSQLINATNIYFSDEQNPNIQEQAHIIISERVPVESVRKQARDNGIPEEQIKLIMSDEELETQIGQTQEAEVETASGKCTSLLYFTKIDGELNFCRSVKNVIYQPMKAVPGMEVYPIAGMRWETYIGTARGVSGVKSMIPNQIQVNQIAVWRSECLKKTAFPKLAVDETRVSNPDALDVVGATIRFRQGGIGGIRDSVGYINPAQTSPDAQALYNETISMTRELEGAGDAATGAVDPTKASGEAIKAARDQAAVPLNEQVASYKQYTEDVATIWYNLYKSGSVNGLDVPTDDGVVTLNSEELENLQVDIKIDVTPIDPYSRVAQEILLKELFQGGQITFEEYVNALSDTSSMPKDKLEEIIENRAEQIDPRVIQILRENPRAQQLILQSMPGGEQGAVEGLQP